MNNQEQNVIIKPASKNKLPIIIALIVLPLLAYRRFLEAGQHPEEMYHWIKLAFFVLLWFIFAGGLLFKKDLTKRGAITLTPEGFYKGTTLYKWYEIEQFGIETQNTTFLPLASSTKTVFWNYRSSSLNITLSQKLSKIISGHHDSIYSVYEIEADKLVQLLNDWRSRHTGSRAEVLQVNALDKKISNKTAFLIIGLIILIIVAFALFAIPYRK